MHKIVKSWTLRCLTIVGLLASLVGCATQAPVAVSVPCQRLLRELGRELKLLLSQLRQGEISFSQTTRAVWIWLAFGAFDEFLQ